MKKYLLPIIICVLVVVAAMFILKPSKQSPKKISLNGRSLVVEVTEKYLEREKLTVIALSKDIVETFVMSSNEPTIKIDDIRINKEDVKKLLSNENDTLKISDVDIDKSSHHKKGTHVNISVSHDSGDSEPSKANIKMYTKIVDYEKKIAQKSGNSFVIESIETKNGKRESNRISFPTYLIKGVTGFIELFGDSGDKNDIKTLKELLSKSGGLVYINSISDSSKVWIYIE